MFQSLGVARLSDSAHDYWKNHSFDPKDLCWQVMSLLFNMLFRFVMYRCESWAIKKIEGLRIDGFELWCWRRPLRIPWTARRSDQSVLKEISP